MTQEPTSQAPTQPDAEAPKDHLVVTHHAITLGGEELRYTATAGTLVLREERHQDGVSEGEKASAAVFFVAYSKDGADPGSRPVTFAFNGGPGSSSV
jgi:carboxypeptidase C (cathepsin A)